MMTQDSLSCLHPAGQSIQRIDGKEKLVNLKCPFQFEEFKFLMGKKMWIALEIKHEDKCFSWCYTIIVTFSFDYFNSDISFAFCFICYIVIWIITAMRSLISLFCAFYGINNSFLMYIEISVLLWSFRLHLTAAS